MLYKEIIAVCYEVHEKHIKTLFGGEGRIFFFLKPGGTFSNHWALKVKLGVKSLAWITHCFSQKLLMPKLVKM
jgi:hypothetical protein